MSGRDRMMFTAKMKIVSSAATRKRKRENLAKPTSKALWPWLSVTPVAIRPKAVRVPVWTTTARRNLGGRLFPCTRSLRARRIRFGDGDLGFWRWHGLTGQNGFVTLELIDTE